MVINGVFTEPGVFSQFQPQATAPVLPGGLRIAALVGAGRTTNIVTGESVTKGSLNAQDTLAHTATSLGSQIIDEDFNTYNLGIDYQLTSGKVDWSITMAASITGTVAEPYNGLVGKTFVVTVAGGSPQTYTFVSGDFVVPTAATASEVATALTTNLTGITASVDTSKVKVATTAGDNTDLLIGAGTSNSILGFIDGSFVVTPKEPAPGKLYSANYEYAKVSATDFKPTFFFSMDQVTAAYGDVSDTNTLSTAAEIVFQHGASAVCLIQVDPADGPLVQQFRKGIDKLDAVSGINFIVPLNPDPTLYSYLSAHVNNSSSITERKERMGIVGLGGSPTTAQITGYATALNSKRMVLVYPPSATRFVGTNQTVSTLDGSFLAAAVAGLATNQAFDVATPLTRKEIIGFQEIPDTLTRAEKNLIASNGVLLIETVGGISRVRQQLTTDPSTRANSEITIVEIVDFTASSMRQLLEAIFIGQKILLDTPAQVRSVITAVLQNLVQAEIITAFQNVTASVNNTDPTQIDVSFQISPVFPLNFILITFSLSPNA